MAIEDYAEFGGLIGRYAWAGTADGREPGSFFAAHAIAVDSKADFYVSQVNWSAGAKNGSLPDDHQVIQKFSRLA